MLGAQGTAEEWRGVFIVIAVVSVLIAAFFAFFGDDEARRGEGEGEGR